MPQTSRGKYAAEIVAANEEHKNISAARSSNSSLSSTGADTQIKTMQAKKDAAASRPPAQPSLSDVPVAPQYKALADSRYGKESKK
jgi:hypothetical protein